MISLLDVRPGSLDNQKPRILTYPDFRSSSGPEAVEYCESVGLSLDPWQRLCLEYGMAESPANKRKWAAFEVAVVVPRQNGKGELLMAREVVGLFLLRERLIIHSAHEFKTCEEAFTRIMTLIDNCPGLSSRVQSVKTANGKESIELKNGARLKFLARSKGSARGFSADTVVFDEAQILGVDPIRAMLPTLSARPNPQIWYAGTAGNEASIHLGGVRRRGMAGGSSLAYMEWSVNEDDYDPADPRCWAAANPAFNIRIDEAFISNERATFAGDQAGFAAERLGVGDWPSDDTHGVIPAAAWEACADRDGEKPAGSVVFAVDVNPERTAGAICVAGRRVDGRMALEVVDQRAGLDWMVPRLVELVDGYGPLGVVVDVGGPAGTLHSPLEALNAELVVPSSQEVAQSAEGLYDAVMDGTLVHQDDPRLNGAVQGAKKRPIGEAWGWGRRQSTTDISPLVAGSLALWGFARLESEAGQPTVYVI